MKKDKPSNAIINFRKELDDILNTILATARYQYTFMFLKDNKDKFKIPDDIFNEFINPLEHFEERNFTYNYLFITVITVLETYLKDRLIEELENFPEKKEKLLKEYKINRKLEIEDVLSGIDPIVKEILDSVIYHNFSKGSVLYRIILDIKILDFIPEELWTYVKIRHELVHRAGNIDKKKLLVSEYRLITTMSDVSKWAENIDYLCRKGVLKKKHISIISKYDKHSKKYPDNEFFSRLMRRNYGSKVKSIDYQNDEYIYV